MLTFSLEDLLAYTDWQRAQWRAILPPHGADALTASAGPHGDGKFEAVGDLIKHISSAERRYVAGSAVTGRSVASVRLGARRSARREVVAWAG